MFSTLSRRCFSLLSILLLLFIDLMPSSAAAFTTTTQLSVEVKGDCLGCSLAQQFPSLHQQLEGEVPWTVTTRHFGKRTLTGLTAIASSTTSIQPPVGLKPLEQQAWLAIAKRGQMQLFLPQRYSGSTVVEQRAVRVEVQPIGAQSARAEQQNKTLVYKNAYPSTDSLQIVRAGRSQEFLYLRNSKAPRVFDYRVKVSKGVQVRSETGSVAFVDSRGQGVRIEKPWLVDSNGKRSESVVHWQILEGGRHLQLVVEPQGLRYPLVVDPSWTTTGSMTAPRASHTATLLPNGQVLVAGGFNGGFNSGSLSSTELYNPAAGTWSNTGSMSTNRSEHTATVLPSGKVLVAGGQNSNGYLSSAEVYDPSTGTWSSTGSLNTARSRHTATLLSDGKVLVSGGDTNGATTTNSAELYDPQIGTWSSTISMSTARASHTATLLPNGQVLVAGGFNSGSLSSTELYNPAAGTWSNTGSMSTNRNLHTATLLSNGKVLVAGGFRNTVTLTSVELYDPQTGTWSITESMATARYSHTATLLPNGKVLVAGGGNFNNNTNNTLISAELYNPQTGTWSTTSSMAMARSSHTATLLPNGKVLVAGGAGFGVFSSAELYDLQTTDIWITTGSMNTAREAHTATLLPNGKVLVTGGFNSNGIPSSAELYDPKTGAWSITSSLSVPRRDHTATLLSNGKVLVAGGYNDNSIGLSSAELYDPSTSTWSVTGFLTTGRYIHTATLLPNGKILVVGGVNAYSTTELYDPSTGSWSVTGSLTTGRFNHTATLLPNGKLLVAGGRGENGIGLSSVEVYDSATGTWSITGSMVTARGDHTATLLPNGKVLVAGGANDVSSINSLSSAELYNPQTGIWDTIGSMATARYSHTAMLLPNGAVLVAGGIEPTPFSQFLSSAEVYDPQTGIWSSSGSMSTARSQHTATLLTNGVVLVVGSFNVSSTELYGLSTPVIISFSPTSAAVGSIVTLTGSGFTGVTAVSVNGLAASFGYVSDSQLNLQVPAGATSGLITVTTPAGSATSTTNLTVLNNPPTITGFSPTSGPVGTTVTINGADFAGATSVRFRTTEAASFTVLSDSQIQAVVPAEARSGAIVVITPNGFNTSPTKFIVTTP
jgi:uncharacterized delta-60 repeat protein